MPSSQTSSVNATDGPAPGVVPGFKNQHPTSTVPTSMDVQIKQPDLIQTTATLCAASAIVNGRTTRMELTKNSNWRSLAQRGLWRLDHELARASSLVSGR